MIGTCIFLYLASMLIIISSSGWANGFAVNEGVGKASFFNIGLIVILTVFLYINILIYAQFKNNLSIMGNWSEKITSELNLIKANENEGLRELVTTRNMLAMKLIETNEAIKRAEGLSIRRKKSIKLTN